MDSEHFDLLFSQMLNLLRVITMFTLNRSTLYCFSQVHCFKQPRGTSAGKITCATWAEKLTVVLDTWSEHFFQPLRRWKDFFFFFFRLYKRCDCLWISIFLSLTGLVRDGQNLHFTVLKHKKDWINKLQWALNWQLTDTHAIYTEQHKVQAILQCLL